MKKENLEIKQENNHSEIKYNSIIVGQSFIEHNELIMTLDKETGITPDYFKLERKENPLLKDIKGSEIYDLLINLNKGKFEKIREIWNYGSNLKKINELNGEGNLEQLAFETFSGKMAKKHGYDKAEVIIKEKKHNSQEYQTIVTIFYN